MSIEPVDIAIALAGVAAAGAVSLHAVLNRRDPRAAAWWVLMAWAFPFGGAVLYLLFGINRIQRRALRLRSRFSTPTPTTSLAEREGSLDDIARLSEQVAGRPLHAGNAVTAFFSGTEAYAAMLAAIDGAETSVGMSSYIFAHDAAGRDFAAALGRAAKRGVAVRVLIDHVGAGFFRFPARRLLERHGVKTAMFLPSLAPWRMSYLNLRNHRKILTIDGRTGFTGGMNIEEGHRRAQGRGAIRDAHFRLDGPVVADLQETFCEDWHFTTGETLGGSAWFPAPTPAGNVTARGVSDGPDTDLERSRWVILSALSQARRSVRIVTPYFLPDLSLITALNLAAMSGVTVDIVVPLKSDMRVVRWAGQATYRLLIERGVRIWEAPAPFCHAKLMTVDDAWSLFGSSNWDARSFRLNFEFNVECHDPALAARISEWTDALISGSRPVTPASLRARPLRIRVRNAVARLFAPLL